MTIPMAIISFFFVNKNNIKTSCLAKGKLYLNKPGNSIFAKNISSVMKRVWHNNEHVVQVSGAPSTDTASTSPDYVKNVGVTLKRLQHYHLKITLSFCI